MKQVIHQNHRSAERLNCSDLRTQRQIFWELRNTETMDSGIKYLICMKYFCYRIGDNDTFQNLTKRYTHIFPQCTYRQRFFWHTICRSNQFNQTIIHNPCIEGKDQFFRIQFGQRTLESFVTFIQNPQHSGICTERFFDGCLYIMIQHNRLFHIYNIDFSWHFWQRNWNKSLTFQSIFHALCNLTVFGTAYGISVVLPQAFCQGFRQHNLFQIRNFRPASDVTSQNQHNLTRCLLTDVAGCHHILKFSKQFCCGNMTVKHNGIRSALAVLIKYDGCCASGFLQSMQQFFTFIIAQISLSNNLRNIFCIGFMLDFNSFCLKQSFILWLSQIQPTVIDIVLGDSINQIGNISVMVDIFTDSCGADVLKVCRQFQFHNRILNHIIRCLVPSALSGFSAENNMRECHNRIFFRFHTIRGSVLHNVTACHHIDFFSREHFTQFFQICRISNIHWCI